MFQRIVNLPTGRALVVSGGWSSTFSTLSIEGYTHEAQIRSRLTADAGVSKC